MNITLQPNVLQWARLRAGLSEADLGKKLGITADPADRVSQWERDGVLTYNRAQKLAQVTYTPIGYLFADAPPVEKLPIPDFRTSGSEGVRRMSPDLLEVIHQSQRRQSWYREYLAEQGEDPLTFVASFPPGSSVHEAALSMRETLGFHPSECAESKMQEVLNSFSEAAEAAGILVVRAGKVGNNTRRTLDPGEFRGFALVDDLAPLVFVNSADAKAAQIFTLAHELAHIWAGESALSNLERTLVPAQEIERYCNAVAAEYLVPMEDLRARLQNLPVSLGEELERLRRHYRVSDLVIIRRLYDAGKISRSQFQSNYEKRLAEYREERGGGGNFHNNQPNQVGRRFGTALVGSTLEGKTLYRDALALLDMKKESSFIELARRLDFPV
jgi:Zn-dependent peptidase ImmA (M78 family)/transcriptional regulator with XRE-family HTH domain